MKKQICIFTGNSLKKKKKAKFCLKKKCFFSKYKNKSWVEKRKLKNETKKCYLPDGSLYFF